MIRLDQFLIGSMKNFVYLLTSGIESVVIDPQKDLTPWENKISELGSKLKAVICTHTHFDHIAGIPLIEKKYNVPIYIHSSDAFRMKTVKNVSFLKHDELFNLGEDQIKILHTPGHSAGEICLLLTDQKPYRLLTGDTVFVGIVGRTDLETGSDEELFNTIQNIKKLPHDTIIFSGHDYGKTPTTTIGRECLESEAFTVKTLEEFKKIP